MFAHSTNSLLGALYLRCLGESDRNLLAPVCSGSLLTDWWRGGSHSTGGGRGETSLKQIASLSKKPRFCVRTSIHHFYSNQYN